MGKLRVTYHNGRRRKDGAAYCAKHNSRSGGIGNHIIANPERQNIYITIDANGTPSLHNEVDFDKHEHTVYTQLFGASLEAQNTRYRKKGNYDRVRTIDEYRQSHPPEESIFQVGKMGEAVDPDVTLTAVVRWVDEMRQLYGEHWKIVDIALHYDEPGTGESKDTDIDEPKNRSGHAHIRAIWCADGKDGYTVSENKALQQLGIERPDMDKPQSRYNNAKITFTQRARELWVGKVQELNVKVETIPAEPGKRTLTKEEYVAKQLRTEVAELSQERKKIAKEATELAVERDMLKEETTRLRGVLERLRSLFEPISNLWTKLAGMRLNAHKSVLDEVLLSADTAGSLDALREVEERF